MIHNFLHRHIGNNAIDERNMLNDLSSDSMKTFIDKAIPESIKDARQMTDGVPINEHDMVTYMKNISLKNSVYKSFIGQGYYGTIMPSVIQRNVFENPSWYTPYTPYQAEISQGRLESLLNFQTIITELTALPIANASLLDEGTAAAEAMIMVLKKANKKNGDRTFLVDEHVFPQTLSVLKTRAEGIDVSIVTGDILSLLEAEHEQPFGVLVQYPDRNGEIKDLKHVIEICKERHIKIIFAADILSLTLLKTPGEWGADIAVGSVQRFGLPMGYGGPHAAYIACDEEYKRQLPGRIIGRSRDKHGTPALRMALQTREQHIRRDKATSNICTAQALLANLAAMYVMYHGPAGLKQLAETIHAHTKDLFARLIAKGVNVKSNHFFDTLTLHVPGDEFDELKKRALENTINFNYEYPFIRLSCDELTTAQDVNTIIKMFDQSSQKDEGHNMFKDDHSTGIPNECTRDSEFLSQAVFNHYHSESALMRYIKQLEDKDLGLNRAMIPLGSCTMKLNPATTMIPLSWPEYANIHPYCPVNQVSGYMEIIDEMKTILCEITGFDACSMQPNSGAQGEFAGLLTIRAFHNSKNEGNRNIALIPESAHGTNPASAVMAGYRVVVIKCDSAGAIDWTDYVKKADQYAGDLGVLMITYPSTHGVFDTNIQKITQDFHERGGLIYMDGANLNAMVGVSSPKIIGADVCHINLHKTFSIPHGGGGPGMGPICVEKKLEPFLPCSPLAEDPKNVVNAAPFGSALIIIISYMYIKMLGNVGLRKSTETALLNANYIKFRLQNDYPVLFTTASSCVAHELILDCRPFKKTAQISAEDIAKRLMDYGFHAPTLSWPVPDTLMIEPTESENKAEIDRFCDALISIKKEIDDIVHDPLLASQNLLVNAPHTLADLVGEWNHPYSKKQAFFPNQSIQEKRIWPSVNRVDNAFGDRNLVCTCDPIEAYAEQPVS